MQKASRQQLEESLQKLEKLYNQIYKEQGFSKEAEQYKLLFEMIKEQVPNEDSMHSTC